MRECRRKIMLFGMHISKNQINYYLLMIACIFVLFFCAIFNGSVMTAAGVEL